MRKMTTPKARIEAPDRLRLRLIQPGLWRLLSDYKWTFKPCAGSEVHVCVPRDFQTTLASPRPVGWIFDLLGLPRAPFVIHDWFYELVRRKVITRAYSDAVFLESMRVYELHWAWRGIIWAAVRLFGWFFVLWKSPQ